MPAFAKTDIVILNSNQKEQPQKINQNISNLKFYNVDEEYLYQMYRYQQALLDPKYKTELCKSFISEGFCRYRYKCRFAHGLQDLISKNKPRNNSENPDTKVKSQHTSKNNEVVFREENSCNNSSTDISIQIEPEKPGNCENFSIEGYCKNGTKCFFPHYSNINTNEDYSINQMFILPIRKYKRLPVFESITSEFKQLS